MRRLALLALLAALAGCGGKSSPVDDAAQLVPANARAYAVFTPGGGERALERRAPLVARETNALRVRFGLVRPPVETRIPIDVARLPAGVVAFAHPADAKRFAASLHGFAHATIGGWVVFSRSQAAVDAVRHRRATLADRPGFQAAVRALPGRPAYWAYAPGWSAAAITARGRTVTCEVASSGATRRNVDTAAVTRRIPARAIVAFAGAPENVPTSGFTALAPAARFLSLDLPALVEALDGPFAAWAGAGAPVPEVTIDARPRDPAHALPALRRVLARMAGTAPRGELDLGPLTVTTTLAGGELVASDVAAPFAGPGPLHVHGLPDATEWWLWVDAPQVRVAADALAALSNQPAPAFAAALAPLRSVLAYAQRAGTVETTVASYEVA